MGRVDWFVRVRVCVGIFRVDFESERGVAAPATEVGREMDNRVFGIIVRDFARFRRENSSRDHGNGCSVFVRGSGVNFERGVSFY